MSGQLEVPEGEDVLMQGAFDPAVYRREATASAIVVAIVLAVIVFFALSRPLILLAALVVALGAAAVAMREHREGRNRHWSLTSKALYLSDRPPVPLADISRLRGSSNNVRLNVRGQRKLVLLGEAQAIALRERLRDLRAGART